MIAHARCVSFVLAGLMLLGLPNLHALAVPSQGVPDETIPGYTGGGEGDKYLAAFIILALVLGTIRGAQMMTDDDPDNDMQGYMLLLPLNLLLGGVFPPP